LTQIKSEARGGAANIAKLPALPPYRVQAAAVPMASAKCQSEGALFGGHGSLQYLVGNVESQSLLIRLSLAK
jgi:hypothetical protein